MELSTYFAINEQNTVSLQRHLDHLQMKAVMSVISWRSVPRTKRDENQLHAAVVIGCYGQ